jgi:CHAD domain-containing protein
VATPGGTHTVIMADHDTAGSVITEYLAEQCDRLITLTSDDLADAEVVHDTRIALRRLRSTLRTFADLFPADQATELDREARWLGGLLGELRDRDVLADRIADHADRAADLSPGQVSPVLAELGDQREQARRELEVALRSARTAELLATILIWRNWPPLTEVADQPAALIGDRVRQARKKERKRVRQAIRTGAHDEELHRARKAAKRHRYALEIEALAGAATAEKSKKKRKKRKKRAKRSRKLQRLLGRHQDAVVAARFLESRPDGPETAEVRRRLIRRERAIAADTRLGGGSR